RAGFWTGQKPPLGYTVVRTPGDHGGRRRNSGKLAIDPETAPLVRELFERYVNGERTPAPAPWLTPPTGPRRAHQAISMILRRELYVGRRLFGPRTKGRHARLVDGQATILAAGTEVPVKGDVIVLLGYPSIISEELFSAAARRLAGGKSKGHHKGAV